MPKNGAFRRWGFGARCVFVVVVWLLVASFPRTMGGSAGLSAARRLETDAWVSSDAAQARWLHGVGRAQNCSYEVRANVRELNALLTRIGNRLTKPTAVCLSGSFDGQVRIINKWNRNLLTLEPVLGATPVITVRKLTQQVLPPAGYDALNAALVIQGSRDVRILGLRIERLLADSASLTPVGIDVEVNAPGYGPHPSRCLKVGCSGIVLADNTVSMVENRADEKMDHESCGAGDINALGIVVEDYGDRKEDALRHVVITGNTVGDTRTGSSENLVVNGDVDGFVIADNHVINGDNIGIDVEGWYNGTSQPIAGLIQDNEVSNIDTTTNATAGSWSKGRCIPAQNGAGIYDDGGRELWFRANVVVDTNQGISLDTENPHRSTSALWVTGNRVVDAPGTSNASPSFGPSPVSGLSRSTDAGHGFDAVYVDAFGRGSQISGVVIADNELINRSRHFGEGSRGAATVIALGGNYRDVALCANEIVGSSYPTTSLLGIDARKVGATRWISLAGNRYGGLAPGGPNFVIGNVTISTVRGLGEARHLFAAHSSQKCASIERDLP